MPLQVAIKQHDGTVAEHLLFEGRDYSVGRSLESDVVINHPQVSRSHALINADNDKNWFIDDISSTGCFSFGQPIKKLKLDKAQHLHLGPVSCELKPLDYSNVIKLDSQREWRRTQLSRYQSQLQHCDSSVSLVHLARECLTQSLGCERASLVLFDNISQFQLGVGYEPWMNGDGFTGSRTIIKRSMEQGDVLALGNIVAENDFNTQHSIIKYGIQAAISVPVVVNDRPVGVLYADSTKNRMYFTQTDIEFARSLANLISLRLLFHTIEHKLSLIS